MRIVFFACLLGFLASFAFVTTRGSAITINEITPAAGSTALATPVACATASAVSVALHCSTTLNPGLTNKNTNYIKFCVYGGTAGTDYAVLVPAGPPGTCGAAAPAPVTSSVLGEKIPTGTCEWFNFPAAGGNTWFNSEWDAQCTTSGMTIGRTTFP